MRSKPIDEEKQNLPFIPSFVRMFQLVPLVAGVLFGGMLSGCGEPGRPATLKGTVKFEGELIVKGAVRLSTEDGTPGPGGLSPIQDGHYEINSSKGLKAGKYLVAIYGFKQTGRMIQIDDSAPARPEELQYIPRRYNDSSNESIEIQAGANTKDFELTP